MSSYDGEMMQDKKKDLKNLAKWTSCFYPKENPTEDRREESAVETLNFRPLRLY